MIAALNNSFFSLYVIDNNTVPAMLIEYGFLTDQNDAAYVCSEDGQQKLAQQLAISIQKNVPLSKSWLVIYFFIKR